jgi:UDP-glucose 4-epimerase
LTVLGLLREGANAPEPHRRVRRRRRRAALAGVPATRDLELTLRALLVLAGAGLVVSGSSVPILSKAAVVATLVVLAAAAVVLCAVTALRPPVLRWAAHRRGRSLRVAVIGTTDSALELEAELRRCGVAAVVVAGAICPRPERARTGDGLTLGTLADVGRIVAAERIALLLVAPGISRALVTDAVMRSCEGDPVRLCELATFYEDVFGRVPVTGIDGRWFECVLHPRFRDRRAGRVFDVLVASVLAAVCLPVLTMLAVIIRADGGPALYRQRRIGRYGRPFEIYKLRTMRWDPDDGAPCWSSRDDARVTPLGRRLRRTHLDELPQLWNVLRGDMAIVGPRPEQPELAAQLEATIPGWRGRYRHKPGLTGWAQIRGGYGGSNHGSAFKLAHDLYYLRRRSLTLDAAILIQTASTLLFARQFDELPETPFVVRRPARREDSPSRRPALVTGGAGFIGSHLVDALLEAGHDVVVVDDLSAGSRANLAGALARGAELVELDVTDAAAIRDCFVSVRPEVVFHLAARIDVGRSVRDPLDDAAVNVAGTLAVLEASVAAGVGRFVMASSGGAIYGDAVEIPTAERAPVTPLSPYGASKAAAEQYVAMYGRLHGLSALCLRLANVYGPRQGGSRETGAIARFCDAKLSGEDPPVFGDGLQTRDYVFVRDVVGAFVAAGSSPATGALNVGTGIETSVVELVNQLGQRPDFQAPRTGEVRRSCLDASAARIALRWRPQVPLPQGLSETLAAAAGAPVGDAIEAQQSARA